MATSRKIAKKAARLLKKSRSYVVREVSGSDLAQAPRRRRKKAIRRSTTRARRRG
jgi:hypothetical protein